MALAFFGTAPFGAVILQGLTTGFGIAAVLVATGTVPSNLFFTIGQTISLNEGVPAVVAGVLAYEHSLVSPSDWKRLDTAFFAANGVISIAFFAFVLAEVLV